MGHRVRLVLHQVRELHQRVLGLRVLELRLRVWQDRELGRHQRVLGRLVLELRLRAWSYRALPPALN